MVYKELRFGDEGSDVRLAQNLMNRIGMLLEDDGIFGETTRAAVRESQKLAHLDPTGRIDQATWVWLDAQAEPSADIATKAVSFIARAEVGSRPYYERHASRPIFPGAESGITIGVGYDLRFHTVDSFRADWGSVLSEVEVNTLLPFVGRSGSEEASRQLDRVLIPWRYAWIVFTQRSLPVYIGRTRAAFTAFNELPPLCRGVLVSLVYNRGAQMNGESRTEMRTIRDALYRGEYSRIPEAILSMKRLWPNHAGLRLRRDREAELFREGLGSSV
jgi:hypothetical protein